MKTVIRNLELTLLGVFLSAVVFATTFGASTLVFERIFGDGLITEDMRAVEPIVLDEDGWFSVQVIGIKREARSACVPRAEGFRGFRFDGEIWVGTEFEFRESSGGGGARPSGLQSFGIWAWRITDDTTLVKLTSVHDCPTGDVIGSTYGPFSVVR